MRLDEEYIWDHIKWVGKVSVNHNPKHTYRKKNLIDEESDYSKYEIVTGFFDGRSQVESSELFVHPSDSENVSIFIKDLVGHMVTVRC